MNFHRAKILNKFELQIESAERSELWRISAMMNLPKQYKQSDAVDFAIRQFYSFFDAAAWNQNFQAFTIS